MKRLREQDPKPEAARLDEINTVPDPVGDVFSSFQTKLSNAKSEAEVREVIDAIGRYLITHMAIVAHNPTSQITSKFLITEVELYCSDKQRMGLHDDVFTHCDPLQEVAGCWYFHKMHGTYKAGTYKGLDVTFGMAGFPCGALIRSVQRDLDGNDVVEGPSLVVDTLLAACGASSIVDLVGSQGSLTVFPKAKRTDLDGTEPTNSTAMRLRLEELALPSPRHERGDDVAVAPRVGLVPKTADHLRFAGRFYRYFLMPAQKMKKVRGGIIAAAIVRRGCLSPTGPNAATALTDIAKWSGGTAKSVQAIHSILMETTQRAAAAGNKLSEEDLRCVLHADVTTADVIARIVACCCVLLTI